MIHKKIDWKARCMAAEALAQALQQERDGAIQESKRFQEQRDQYDQELQRNERIQKIESHKNYMVYVATTLLVVTLTWFLEYRWIGEIGKPILQPYAVTVEKKEDDWKKRDMAIIDADFKLSQCKEAW